MHSTTHRPAPRGLVLGTRRTYHFPQANHAVARCIKRIAPMSILPHHWPHYVYAGQRQTPFTREV